MDETIIGKKERLLFLDIAKVLSLFIMPITHFFDESKYLGLLSSSYPVSQTEAVLGIVYSIGPTMFMFCMGVGMVYTKHNTEKDFLHRGLILIGIFFALNVFRYVIPSIIYTFITGSFNIWNDTVSDFFISDILFFAGLAFLFFSAVKRFNLSKWTVLCIGIVISAVQYMIPQFDFGNSLSGQILTDIAGWFVYTRPEQSFFPFIGWLIFPAIGFVYGQYLMESKDKDRMHKRVVLISAIATIVMICIPVFITKDFTFILWSYRNGFFMSSLSALYCISLIMAVISALYLLTKNTSNGKIKDLFVSVSKEVNGIYCIHWVVLNAFFLPILYCMGARMSSPLTVFAGGLLLFIISAYLSPRLKKLRKRFFRSKMNGVTKQ